MLYSYESHFYFQLSLLLFNRKRKLQLLTAGYSCSFNIHTNFNIHSTFNQLYKSHLMLGILQCYKYYPLSNYMVLRPVAYLVTLKCSVFSASKWIFHFSWILLLLYANQSFWILKIKSISHSWKLARESCVQSGSKVNITCKLRQMVCVSPVQMYIM